jgi:acetyl-CoA carboxylase biotin carboxyl carrier protein
MDINIEQIRELADLALDKNLAELTVTDTNQTVTIKTAASVQAVTAGPMMYPVQHPVENPSRGTVVSVQESMVVDATMENAPAAPASNLHTVTSPMVGTFYRSPSPESPPFVEAGQSVSPGQAVCIIEAMKLMNELECEVSGKVVKFLVENGQPVEFGQALLQIEPS